MNELRRKAAFCTARSLVSKGRCYRCKTDDPLREEREESIRDLIVKLFFLGLNDIKIDDYLTRELDKAGI